MTESGDADCVEKLVANCLDHARSEWRSVVDQICAETPEHAEEVLARVARLERCGLLSEPGVDGTIAAGSGTDSQDSESPDRFGRYRILKEL